MPFSIGYAQSTISPSSERLVYLAGFGLDRQAQTIHDDLYARALAIRDERQTLVLVALDLIGLSRSHSLEITSRFEETSLQVIIASTHTHHGPDTIGLWGPDRLTSGVDAGYMQWLKEQVGGVIHTVLNHLEPADLKAASVIVPGLAKNARDPHILDNELTCLQFTATRNSRILATLLDFPCHPEVLWEHNPHISSDYPGALRCAVEDATKAPCLFFPGALGGMMTPDVKDHSFEEAQTMGRRLAEAGLSALDRPAVQIEGDSLSLYHSRKEFKVPLSNVVFQMGIQAGLLPEIRNEQGEVITEVNLIQLGPAWLVCVPGELLPKLGLELKEWMRLAGAQVAGVIGLANDELGYILPGEDFAFPEDPFDPGDHYEETMSVGPDAGPRLMRAVRSLICEIVDLRDR